jgi:Uma2 family endonuclease
MANRSAVINLNEPPPLLVVEVVSSSTQADDYRSKRSVYSLLEISEYWIVDPLAEKLTICTLAHQFYDCIEYGVTQQLTSTIFSFLSLLVIQVLAAKL